jgi:hypothetical protein
VQTAEQRLSHFLENVMGMTKTEVRNAMADVVSCFRSATTFIDSLGSLGPEKMVALLENCTQLKAIDVARAAQHFGNAGAGSSQASSVVRPVLFTPSPTHTDSHAVGVSSK